jgi:hypothetical protein
MRALAGLLSARHYRRRWSPRSPSPFFTVVLARLRWSADSDRLASSCDLVNLPPFRRTYRLSSLCGSMVVRGIALTPKKRQAQRGSGACFEVLVSGSAGRLAGHPVGHHPAVRPVRASASAGRVCLGRHLAAGHPCLGCLGFADRLGSVGSGSRDPPSYGCTSHITNRRRAAIVPYVFLHITAFHLARWVPLGCRVRLSPVADGGEYVTATSRHALASCALWRHGPFDAH